KPGLRENINQGSRQQTRKQNQKQHLFRKQPCNIQGGSPQYFADTDFLCALHRTVQGKSEKTQARYEYSQRGKDIEHPLQLNVHLVLPIEIIIQKEILKGPFSQDVIPFIFQVSKRLIYGSWLQTHRNIFGVSWCGNKC